MVRIVDGDTLRVIADRRGADRQAADSEDDSLRPGVETVVRLLEIDTPESNGSAVDDCFAAEATRELTRLLPVGSTAWVVPDRELLDRYDRTLLYVWNAQGEFVNEAMVAGGFAHAVLFRPNDLHIERLRAAERRARDSRAGLWSACPQAR